MTSLELKIPPPVVALFFGLCMWLASSLVAPLELPFVLRVGAALTLVAVGLVVSTAGVVLFRRARTTIDPTKPMATSALVSGGIYRVTRNPMYLGLLAGLLGWAAFLAKPTCSASRARLRALHQPLPNQTRRAHAFGLVWR
jgi:protein-S-isoprenylcysteine O-methyltransferase Ste14